MIKKRQSLSYAELLRTGRDVLEQLAEANLLDGPTRDRCAHLARFFERVSLMGPAKLKISDLLTEAELLRIWRETADEGKLPNIAGQRPLIH
jgi:hypothetical protein